MDVVVIHDRLVSLGIAPINRQVAEYWLSLSQDGALPQREVFDPNAVSTMLRGCGLFDVRVGQSIHVRIPGMMLRLAFGRDIAGEDWLAITSARHRDQRLARFSAVAQGAIGVGRRRTRRASGDDVDVEEVMLPFTPGDDGVCPVLVHTNWRPEGQEWFGVESPYAMTLASEFHLVPFE